MSTEFRIQNYIRFWLQKIINYDLTSENCLTVYSVLVHNNLTSCIEFCSESLTKKNNLSFLKNSLYPSSLS